jgi:DNA mismatch endonuclease (patch repair protein)
LGEGPGRPDVASPGRRVAVFVNGCFWHRCPYCSPPVPTSNVPFWQDKFLRNAARDAANLAALEEQGWSVLIVWECQIRSHPDEVVNSIAQALVASH